MERDVRSKILIFLPVEALKSKKHLALLYEDARHDNHRTAHHP